MALRIKSREQLENARRARGSFDPEDDEMDENSRIFCNLEVDPQAVSVSPTPAKLDVFADTAETQYLMEGGADDGYSGAIRMPCDATCFTAAALTFQQASGVVRRFFYDLYVNGTLKTKGGGPAAESGVVVVAPILTLDRFNDGDVLEIYGYSDAGTFNVNFLAGHFMVMRIR